MATEDFFESEVAMAAAATAAMLSPRVRGAMRQGLVLGLAGADRVARTVAGAASTAGRSVADAMPVGNDSAGRQSARSPGPARATSAKATRKAPVTRARAKRAPTRTGPTTTQKATRASKASPTTASGS